MQLPEGCRSTLPSDLCQFIMTPIYERMSPTTDSEKDTYEKKKGALGIVL